MEKVQYLSKSLRYFCEWGNSNPVIKTQFFLILHQIFGTISLQPYRQRKKLFVHLHSPFNWQHCSSFTIAWLSLRCKKRYGIVPNVNSINQSVKRDVHVARLITKTQFFLILYQIFCTMPLQFNTKFYTILMVKAPNLIKVIFFSSI